MLLLMLFNVVCLNGVVDGNRDADKPGCNPDACKRCADDDNDDDDDDEYSDGNGDMNEVLLGTE
jgi:hypothetical protein